MRADNTKQFIRGAALAAVLIAPSLAHAGPARDLARAQADVVTASADALAQAADARAQAAQARAQALAAATQARADAARAAAMAQAMPRAVRVAETGGWVKGAVKSYPAHALKVSSLVGSLLVTAKPKGPITVQVSGIKSRVDGVHLSSGGGVVRIEGEQINSVWDWRNWFNFSLRDEAKPQNLIVKVSVPKGAAVDVHGMIGNVGIGDTFGPLKLEAVAAKAKIGHVSSAKLSFAGSGKADVADVSGPLHLKIAGSGKVRVARTGDVKAEIAGAGDASLGTIDGGLRLSIAGSGDVAANVVNGPVKISIAGSGSVKIAKGQATPLNVSIVGSGNVNFGGNAVDPDLNAFGSGSVRLKSYTGHLSSTGSVSVKVNGKSVSAGSGDDSD